ncbi:hypothetical protein QQ045_020805 [Rhodiola kirilowii]
MAEPKCTVGTTCHLWAGPLLKTTSWNIPPLLRDSFSMIGSAVGGISSAFYGFNFVMPIVQKRIKGPMWLHFVIGAPLVVVFSSACAGFMGGAIPAVAQFGITSYHAASSSPTQDVNIYHPRPTK